MPAGTRRKIVRRPLAVNARFLCQEVTGTQRFAINISRELKKLRPDTIFLAPPDITNLATAQELRPKIIGDKSYRLRKRLGLPASLFWEQYTLPRFLANNGYPRLLNLVNQAPLPYSNNFITIHDLAFKLHPQFFSRRFSAYYNFMIPRLSRRARHIFTVSRHSKADICRHFLIPGNKLTVIYNATDFEPSEDGPPCQPPYILSVGSLEPRKNISRLISAFTKLGRQDIRLVITGKASGKIFREDPLLDASNGRDCGKNIYFTGYLDDRELARYYTNALLFCYPSLYEGFGLPPLEAQACGCPVLLSDRSALPEVFGDSAIYCDPEDIADIADKLRKLIDDSGLRARLKQAGYANCRRFNWHDATTKILEHLEPRT